MKFFIERIKKQLNGIQPGRDDGPHDSDFRKAAVMILILNYEQDPELVLMKRAPHLKWHAGEISFAGGVVDASDRNLTETAKRELREEIGIEASLLEILGEMSPVMTSTGFIVTPVIAVCRGIPEFFPDHSEVQQVFTVPLRFFQRREPSEIQIETTYGVKKSLGYFYEHGIIWGATARMILNFLKLLDTETRDGQSHI